ncbi:hypothetical protein ACGFYQ_33825 [Streptomyces sp. NPDC048258]|uniref:hypothetical protein n=1 Tax=Streptomyces sp. NPDC048258 TaxID=3365527 RepID=UPI0037217628
MSSTRYAWSPMRCTTCSDDSSQFVLNDSDRTDSFRCTRCQVHGHLPYVHIEELADRLKPGQTLALRSGALHIGTPVQSPGSARHEAPEGLTVFTLGVVRLAEEKELSGTWHTLGKAHHFHFRASCMHGVFGSITIGARTGKILRGQLTHGRGAHRVEEKGTNAVRSLLSGVTPPSCPPSCAEGQHRP